MAFRLAILVTLIQFAAARVYTCNFSRALKATDRHIISSPIVPHHYRGSIDCHWSVSCPPGYICLIDCPEVNIPKSENCQSDALTLQTSPQTLRQRYCGNSSITATSIESQISVGLRTQYGPNGGGKFFCQITCLDGSEEGFDEIITTVVVK